jgi:hypothetical protein
VHMDPEAGHGERITVPDRPDPAAEGTELAGCGRTCPHLKARPGTEGLTERSGVQVVGVLVRDQPSLTSFTPAWASLVSLMAAEPTV